MATPVTDITKQAGGYFLFTSSNGERRGSSHPTALQKDDKVSFFDQRGQPLVADYNYANVTLDGTDYPSAEELLDACALAGMFLNVAPTP